MKKKITFLCIGITILFLSYFKVISTLIFDTQSVVDLYTYIFGFVNLSENEILRSLCQSLVHTFFVIYIFSDDIAFEAGSIGSYIFTRTNRRDIWIIKNYAKKIAEIAVYFIIQYLLIGIVAYYIGYRFGNLDSDFLGIVNLLGINIINITSMVIVISTISLFCEYIYGYITVIIITIANIFWLSAKIGEYNHAILKYLPFIQNLVVYKDCNFINRSVEQFQQYISGYTLSLSLMICITIIIIATTISLKRIKHMDIL